MGEPAERVPFVGLTGGLGAGKSTALGLLEELGAAVLSTDAVVHELLGLEEVVREVVDRLGPGVVDDGRVNRGAVAEHVFESSEDREWLEGLLWPLVGARMAAWREEVEQRDPPPAAAVVEVPLLFEAGMGEAFDSTIAVVAGEEVRAERAGRRGHTAVDERAGRQLSQEEKSQRADYTVRNEGSVDELKSQLSNVLASIGG